MKKILILVYCLISVASFPQRRNKNNGYLSITPQFGFYKGGYNAGGAVNTGVKIGKMAGIGLGVEVLKFKDVKNPYIPVYGDFRYFFAPAKGSQVFFTAQPGYGFYNQTYSALVPLPGGGYAEQRVENKGGFYFGTGLGVRGTGKVAPIVSVRYTNYEFNNEASLAGSGIKSSARKGGVSINFGIVF